MKKILVEDRQTLMDITIQEYGKTDALVILCMDNNKNFDDLLQPGETLLIREELPAEADANVVELFVMRGIQVTTGDATQDPEILLDEEGNPIEQENDGDIEI